MSYILESLKKSDQERQSSQPVTDTAARHMPDGYLTEKNNANTSSAFSVWVIIVVFLFGFLGAFLWYLYDAANEKNTEDVRPLSSSVQPIDESAETSSTLLVNSEVVNSRAVNPKSLNLKAKNPKYQNIKPQNAEALIVNNRDASVGDELPVSNQMLPSTTVNIAVEDQSKDDVPQAIDALYQKTKEDERVSINSLYEESNAIGFNAKNRVVQKKQEPPKKELAAIDAPRAVPSIFSLDRQLQQSIPAISYDAHIYASDNKSGFVILDGAKRRAGEKMSSGIYIEGIDEDMVLLSFRGVIFSLPAMKSWRP